MAQFRAQFAARIDAEVLAAMRALAEREGRSLRSLVDEALADLLAKRRQAKPRAHVMAAYLASRAAFAPLYKKLGE